MVRLASGQEVFLEARLPGGGFVQVGFAQVAAASPREIALDVDETPAASGAAGESPSIARSALQLDQSVRLRMSDESGAYFGDTQIVRIDGARVVVDPPAQIEVEWERSFFRLDVRVPFVTRIGDGESAQIIQGNTRDLSGGGLRFGTRDGLELGTRVSVTVNLPASPLSMYPSRPSMRAVAQPSMRPSIAAMQSVRPGVTPPPPQTTRAPAMPAARPYERPGQAHETHRPEAPGSTTAIETEAIVVRCRMSWTATEVSHDVGLHFVGIHERTRDRIIAYLLDEQRRRKALGLDQPPSRASSPR